MKDVHDQRAPIAALAGKLDCDGSPAFFRFLLRRIHIADVRLEGETLVYASFLPVEQLLSETLQSLRAENGRPQPCRVCAEYFDVDTEPGIFAEPQEFEGFICRACAEQMTAWSYFQTHLKL